LTEEEALFCSKCGKETTENALFCAGCGGSLTGGQPPKKKTQLSLAAGIIDIAAGGFSLVSLLLVTIFLFVLIGSEDGVPFFVALIPLAMLVPGVIAIVGGIFALRRRSWVMALIGSIALIVTSSVAGIAALVLTVMARDEFE
jgi:uncharacterized membrane protein HdeD (DUF308 family)